MPTIDFGKAVQDAKGASFEALPIGDYDVEITKSEATTSSNGKPMIKVTMKVIAGPYEKRPIINNFVLSLENAMATAIFFRHMKAFGLTEDWFASLGQQQSLEPVASALMGRRARLALGQREWNGEMRNEVKGVKPYTGAPGAPLAAPNGNVPGPGAALPRPVAGPTAPAAPVAPPAPAPVAPPAPVAHPAPAAPVAVPATHDAPPLPPQVQPMPQPTQAPEPEVPAVPTQETASAVPTSASYQPSAESSGSEVAPSSPPAPTPATSEAPAPPQLPF